MPSTRTAHHKTIFDIGMYDGADTAYYLESGYRVVAVEANPALCAEATRRFKAEIDAGRFICVNAAISPQGKDVELTLCGQDIGSSSIFGDQIAHRRPMGALSVPGVTLQHLFDLHGVPEYLKVDIEGADRLCILSLSRQTRPAFVSFEVSEDVDELVAHLDSIGFERFKIISQVSFRELDGQRCLYDRLTHRLMRMLGYGEPRLIKRAGRFFVSGHSSGPVPWHSDGRWQPGAHTRSKLREAQQAKRLLGWYDVHAA